MFVKQLENPCPLSDSRQSIVMYVYVPVLPTGYLNIQKKLITTQTFFFI